MTNEERRRLDANKRFADEIVGQPAVCPHGEEMGQVVAAAATKDGVSFQVKMKTGDTLTVTAEQMHAQRR